MSYGTRKEHLEFCKRRALEYLDRGEPIEAFTSMVSDLSKHPETCSQELLSLFTAQVLGGLVTTPAAMRQVIEGFN